jgi:hypothetical protein
MKKTAIIFTLLTILAIGNGFSKNPIHQLHHAIHQLFKVKYPEAKHVHWTYLENGYTEADFLINNQVMIVYYDKDGNLTEMDKEISWSLLPANAVSFIKETYTGASVSHVLLKEMFSTV